MSQTLSATSPASTQPPARRRTARLVATVIGVVAAVAALVAGLALVVSYKPTPNTDPRHGSVAVSKDRIAEVTKHCEGSTLVWLTDSYRADPRITSRLEPSSPECR